MNGTRLSHIGRTSYDPPERTLDRERPVTKYPFLSPEWVDAVRRVIAALLAGADLDGIDFAISEQVTNPPPDRTPPNNEPLGWCLRIRDGRLDVDHKPLPDADYRLIVDYHTHHELARRIWAGDETAIAESRALRAQAVAEGKLRTEDDFARAPALVGSLVLRLHDPVAMLTE
jgi:hypothetical protein